MNFLLDTVTLSELRKGRNALAALRSWSEGLSEGDAATSVVCLMELEYGALSVRTKDPAFSLALSRWIETVESDFAGRIFPVDRAVALRCAELLVGPTRPLGDALIAATALVHGLTVVTRNTKHFAPFAVPLFNPWPD